MESRFSDPKSGPPHQPGTTRHSRPPSHVGARALAAALALVPVAAHADSTLPAPPIAQDQSVEVFEASIPDLQEAMADGRVTAVQLVDAYLARISAYDQRGPALNSIVYLNPNARAQAAALDQERARSGARGPLHGIPIILKDNYDTADLPTSGGSIALAGMIPPDDAFQVRKLREAGAIILAKSNMHELAAGITTISSVGGQTRNPYDPSRNPGGSSGGTGAAIAASFAAIGWGSDTCGSIRIPASHHNLFGLRPTKGLSSIDGIIPLSHTQDVGGPLARTVTDLAIGLDATVGADPADPATRIMADRPPPRFVDGLDAEALKGARLGVLTMLFGEAVEDQEHARLVRAALDAMGDAGAEIVDIEIPGLDSILSGSSLIGLEFKWDLIDYLAATPAAQVSSLQDILDRGLYHVRLEGNFRRRAAPQERDTAAYNRAMVKRAAARDVVLATMDELSLDAIAYPTIRRRAARIGDRQRGSNCQLSAATGFPALSVPAGFTGAGLPTGLELLGRPLEDARLLALGFAYEQSVAPRRAPGRTPPLVGGRAPHPVDFVVAAVGGRASARVLFSWDVVTSALSYEVTVSGIPTAEILGTGLHRAQSEREGGVIHNLSRPVRQVASGVITLSTRDRDALLKGELYLRLYTMGSPSGGPRAPLRIP
ncbi:MAG: CHRD domain-containing protein [Gemmatimonadetes bacterium]|nr:CHRD domain-containing protein [Gemmatimonadota bacterium]